MAVFSSSYRQSSSTGLETVMVARERECRYQLTSFALASPDLRKFLPFARFSVCVCVSVCLSVCLFICLFIGSSLCLCVDCAVYYFAFNFAYTCILCWCAHGPGGGGGVQLAAPGALLPPLHPLQDHIHPHQGTSSLLTTLLDKHNLKQTHST